MNKLQEMESDSKRVRVFFYGTFMNPVVLDTWGVIAKDVTPARVADFEINIAPRVNLISKEGASVYGAIASVTHEDLRKIYSDLEQRFGLRYLPEAVLAETMSEPRTTIPALCFIASKMTPGAADAQYVKELAACVRAMNLPESYALHIESFG